MTQVSNGELDHLDFLSRYFILYHSLSSDACAPLRPTGPPHPSPPVSEPEFLTYTRPSCTRTKAISVCLMEEKFLERAEIIMNYQGYWLCEPHIFHINVYQDTLWEMNLRVQDDDCPFKIYVYFIDLFTYKSGLTYFIPQNRLFNFLLNFAPNWTSRYDYVLCHIWVPIFSQQWYSRC